MSLPPQKAPAVSSTLKENLTGRPAVRFPKVFSQLAVAASFMQSKMLHIYRNLVLITTSGTQCLFVILALLKVITSLIHLFYGKLVRHCIYYY
jgi:hypothetical protein